MKVISDELIALGINAQNIHFIDLESREFCQIKTSDELEEILDTIPQNNENQYVFIKEIEHVKDFEEVINAFLNDEHYSIFVTSSKASVLDGLLSTKLKGRYLEFKIYPLTFEEYLDFKASYNKTINPDLLVELNNYFKIGGFPKGILLDNLLDLDSYKFFIIKDIFNKNIKEKTKVQKELFQKVQNFLFKNFGESFSIRSLEKELSNKGIQIERNTLSRYLKILIDNMLIYSCSYFELSHKKLLSSYKKYYLGDISFYFLGTQNLSLDYNTKRFNLALKNLIYLYALSNDYIVNIPKTRTFECDFMLRNLNLDYSYLQVSTQILGSIEAEDRQYLPLEKIRDNYPKYVLTTDTLLQKRNGIKHCNIMTFLKEHKLF